MTKHLTVPGSVMAVLALGASLHSLAFFNEVDQNTIIASARERQTQIMDQSNTILATADAENKRDLTTDERKQVDELAAEFDRLEDDIKRREGVMARNAALTTPKARVTDPDDDTDPAPAAAAGARPQAAAQRPAARQPGTVRVANGTNGFRHFGDFANAVRMASMRGSSLDPRLQNAAASTYGNESSGADGGFAVPPDYRAEIMSKMFGEDSLLARTDRLQSSSNTLILPTDETTPWDSSGGIQAYWTAEAGTKTQSKPALQDTTVRLHTLAALVPVTEELLEDAPAMGSYLNRKVPEKLDFKVSDAIIRGTGVGQPLGILNSPALVTQAAESAQTAATINVSNVVKMLGRLPTQSRANAVWLMHPDAEAQLPLMTVGQQPVYLPPGGIRDNPFGSLLGRPVIPHQTAVTIGTLGDIMLVDFSQYLTVTKLGNGRDANGMRSDVSIHLWFDQDIVAFRFTMRIAGLPWWSAATAQRSGSNTQSPYVVLAAR